MRLNATPPFPRSGSTGRGSRGRSGWTDGWLLGNNKGLHEMGAQPVLDESMLQPRRSSVHPIPETGAEGLRQRAPGTLRQRNTGAPLARTSLASLAHRNRASRPLPQPIATPHLSHAANTRQIVSELLVSLALWTFEADDLTNANAIREDPHFYASADPSDSFHVPNSSREVAYLRLRLWIVAVCRAWNTTRDAGEALVEAIVAICGIIFLCVDVAFLYWRRTLAALSAPLSHSKKSKIDASDSAISLSPTHPAAATFLLSRNLTVLILTQDCAHNLAVTIARLQHGLNETKLQGESTIRYVLVDAASVDATVAIAHHMLNSKKKAENYTAFRALRTSSWASRVSQGLEVGSVSASDLVVVLDASAVLENDNIARVAQQVASLLAHPPTALSTAAFFFPMFATYDVETPLALRDWQSCMAERVRFPLCKRQTTVLVARSGELRALAQLTEATVLVPGEEEWKRLARAVEESGGSFVSS